MNRFAWNTFPCRRELYDRMMLAYIFLFDDLHFTLHVFFLKHPTTCECKIFRSYGWPLKLCGWLYLLLGWQWEHAASVVLAHWGAHLPCEQPKRNRNDPGWRVILWRGGWQDWVANNEDLRLQSNNYLRQLCFAFLNAWPKETMQVCWHYKNTTWGDVRKCQWSSWQRSAIDRPKQKTYCKKKVSSCPWELGGCGWKKHIQKTVSQTNHL